MPTVSSATTVLCLGSTGIARPTSDGAQDGERHVQHPGQEHRQAVVHARDDALALEDRLGQGREGVLEQHDVGDRAGRLAAALHRDAQLRLLERQDVVDAVADHGHPFAALARSAATRRALSDGGTRPNTERVRDGLRQRRRRPCCSSSRPGDRLPVQAQPDLAGERRHGHRVVTRDELERHARVREAGERGACVRPDLLLEHQHAQRLEVGRQRRPGPRRSSSGTVGAPGGARTARPAAPGSAFSATSRSMAACPSGAAARLGPQHLGRAQHEGPARSPSADPDGAPAQLGARTAPPPPTVELLRHPGSARGWRPTTGSGATWMPRTRPASAPARPRR